MLKVWIAPIIAAALTMSLPAEAREGLPRSDPYYGSAYDTWENQLEARRYARQEQGTSETRPAALWDRPLNPEALARDEECQRARDTNQWTIPDFCGPPYAQAQDEYYAEITSDSVSSPAESHAPSAASPASASRWDRDWRADPQYDWQGWRTRNEAAFRLPAYAAPYPDSGYARPALGARLRGGYYDIDYWVAAPERYRLPAPPAQSEWIRYYDDVLLVDFSTGRVTDAIHGFFL